MGDQSKPPLIPDDEADDDSNDEEENGGDADTPTQYTTITTASSLYLFGDMKNTENI